MWCRTRIARAGTCKRRSRQSRALKSARHAPSCAGQCKILPSSAACRNLPSRGRKNSMWCRVPVAAISMPSGLPSSFTVSSSLTTAACERVCADRLRLELRLAEALGARFGDRLVVATDARHPDAADAFPAKHQRMATLDPEIVRRSEKLGPLPHPLAECSARPTAQRRRARLRGRHLHGVDAVDVRALEIKKVPALIDHRDGRLPLELCGMLLGGRDDALDVVAGQARLVAHELSRNVDAGSAAISQSVANSRP